MKKSVLVTGGAGYIGSHIVLALREAGWFPIVMDNLSSGERALVPVSVPFIEGDCGRAQDVAAVLGDFAVDHVIHCAGLIRVDDSVVNPLLYYHANTETSRVLIDASVKAGVKTFLFSSTAAVYGHAGERPVDETYPAAPINPYGHSKRMTEIMLMDAAAAHGLGCGVLRYFNAAGCDPLQRTGQVTPLVTHLIHRALFVALGRLPFIEVYGTDYPTPDGTCVRDYIHVSDLAAAHISCLDHVRESGGYQVINCGYGHGFSVRQVLRAVEDVTGVAVPVRSGERRRGDAASVVANVSFLRNCLKWRPRHDLRAIVSDAFDWERRDLVGRAVKGAAL